MKRRTLSPAESDLWARATRDVARARRAAKVEPREDAPASASAPRERAERAKAKAPAGPARLAPPRSPAYGGGDPKADRRAANRRIEIARTIDLHGLTQAAAERLLMRAIPAAQADGARLVLVVTGKGRGAAADGRAGVLKARFLEWVERPPLRALIARVAPAKPKDGGAGAFYVFLKGKTADARRRS